MNKSKTVKTTSTRHQWSTQEHKFVLDMILLHYKNCDWNELLDDISLELGLPVSKIKALYKSFTRISQGIEPNPTKGGPGHNWGSNVEHSFNEFRSNHKLTQSKLNVIFS